MANFWAMELTREAQRYEREYSREYKTERGLWQNQHSGSAELSNIREQQLYDAIAEYKQSNEWN